MKTKSIMWAFVIATTAFWTACSKDDNNSSQLAAQDSDFITAASRANRAEIDLGNSAASTATADAAVKSYGQMMVTEHTSSQNQLKTIASSKGASSSFKDELDAQHQTLKQAMQLMTGHTFDTAFIHSMVRDHQRTLTLYQTEVSAGKDQSLKDYANALIPHLQMHLQKADSISNAIGQ